ncbi:LysM peptidoglycan-binding domain-containing protein [Polaribacter sp. Hel_I_88]|uniref:LysM peptidoglycan-binding domain-containing protein n=1 Tax=Polaribacter sp. Hel_I_88 TaxID=1250006 RepID=UPI001E48A01E|nr:LysM peptidoglycan-binding domain-containing protein [Polaribacter sp. Hel_I_88]
MKHLKFFVFLCILSFTVSCGQQNKYIQYKVKKGDTASKIAQNLDMSTRDLIRLNPGMDSLPKANSYIVVPQKKLDLFNEKIRAKRENLSQVAIDSINDLDGLNTELDLTEELRSKYVFYEVKKGDTFYNLGKTFDVTRGELLLLNPELKEGLKLGMMLKIREIPIEVSVDEVFYDDYINRNKDLKVALLLPFRAARYSNDTIRLKEIFANNSTLVNIATDFYLGAEIAVDSLRNKGVKIDFNVFDTGERRTNEINRIIASKNLNNNDVIIGPLYSEEVQTVASSVNIPVIFPVYSKNQSDFNSSNIIKTSPDKNVFREELENYIKENFTGGNIIMVSDGKLEATQAVKNMRYSLQEVDTIEKNIYTLTSSDGYIAKSKFLNVLKPNTKNWIIMATDDMVIVSDVVNSLISLPEETTVKLFTFDKGDVYNNIDNRKLAKVGFTYVSDDFVDENSLASRVFRKQYLNKNNALPSFYATKGFDITYDILIRLASGNDLKSTLNEGMSARVETKFDYRNSKFTSENRGLFIVQYNKDLSLTRLK